MGRSSRIKPLFMAALAGTAVAFGSLAPRSASACSCIPPPSAAAAIAKTDAIFEGRVEAVSEAERPGSNLSMGRRSFSFTVLRAWKGVGSDGKVTIQTSGSTASCGYPFTPGETYVVYAWRGEGGALSTNICGRTRKSADAAEDFAALGDPAGPGSPTGGDPPATSPPVSGTTATMSPAPAGGDPPALGGPAGSGAPAGSEPPRVAPSSGGCAGCAVPSGGAGSGSASLVALVASLAVVVRRVRRGSNHRS